MSDLTKLHHEKRLKRRKMFFISINRGSPEPATLSKDGDFFDMSGMYINPFTNVINVLDSVPSYNKVQRIKEENINLKKILKECQNYIINTPILEQGSEQKTKEIHDLLSMIEEALK